MAVSKSKMYFFANFVRSESCRKNCPDEETYAKVPTYINDDPENEASLDICPVRHCGCEYMPKWRMHEEPEPTCVNVVYHFGCLFSVSGKYYFNTYCSDCIKVHHRVPHNDWNWKWVIEHYNLEEIGDEIPFDIMPRNMFRELYSEYPECKLFLEDSPHCFTCKKPHIQYVTKCTCIEHTELNSQLEDEDEGILVDFVADTEIRNSMTSPIPSFTVEPDGTYRQIRPIAASSPVHQLVDWFQDLQCPEQQSDDDDIREFNLYMHDRGYY